MGVSFLTYTLCFFLTFIIGLKSGFKYRTVSLYSAPTQGSGLSKTYLTFSIIILLITCLFKPSDIADYQIYTEFYNKLTVGKMPKMSLEPTFILISYLSPSVTVLFGIYALLSITINVCTIQRYSCNVYLSFLLYLSPYFVLHDMIQIRVAVACALMLWAITFIPARKWKIYLVIITIAVLFHFSAFLFVPFVLLSGTKINKKLYSVIIIALVISAIIHISIGYFVQYIPIPAIQAYYISYASNYTFKAQPVGVVILGKCIMALWMIWKIENIESYFPYAIISLKIFIISLACFIILQDIPIMSGRLYEATGVIDVFAMAMFPLVSKKWRKALLLLPIIFVLMRLPFAYGLLMSTIGN